jgi:hypothetical protein
MQKFVMAFLLFFSFAAQAQIFKNISSIQDSLGFTRLYDAKTTRTVKIAVFDKGFSGYEAEIGKSLPAKTYYVPGPVAAPDDLKTEHGLRMAQIITSLVTDEMQNPDVIREFYLYNVFGYSNFKAAIDDAIARHIDVISYSEVWEYGGNNDGQGFINKQVSRATAAGITWVNAAGNFALTTYNSGITTVADDWVKLPDQNNALSIRCEQSTAGKCNIKVVLSWNDFKNDVDPGTKKDLDLALADDLLNVVQSSALQQSNDPKEERPGYSKYPREILTAEIKPGNYFLRVKNRSKNFGRNDQLRITVDGESITMPSHSNNESVLNPGDNPTVITVGASDSNRSSVSAKMHKPDLVAPSSMVLQDGSEFRGSSNSTAIVAAGIALLKSQNSKLKSRDQILAQISKNAGNNWGQAGLSLRFLGFMPTGRGCFVSREWPQAPAYIQQVLSAGGVLVDTTIQTRLMVPFDPVFLSPQQLVRQFPNDMIVVTPDGQYRIFLRNAPIPQGAVEIFQRPLEAGLCTPPVRSGAKSFRL